MITLHGNFQRTADWDRANSITARLAKKDPTLWGEAARAEASVRLGWVDLPVQSRALLPHLDALVAWSREIGHEHFILCGMGGSSLAPEVMSKSHNKHLVVLDSTDPDQVASASQSDLSRSCIIIGSKSGSTIETSSQRAYFAALLSEKGLDPRDHFVVVTDPGSPLDKSARAEGLKVINADPNVGGRFSALSAFGLVPASLLGIDVSVLLDDAAEATKEFTTTNSTVVQMAAFLAQPENGFVGFVDHASQVPGLGDWIEQLIAESTGKDGRGVLPVVVESESSLTQPNVGFTKDHPRAVLGTLGAQFIFWEWVTALLGYLLGVDPFNQPNVTESKERTSALLADWQSNEIVSRSATLETEHLLIYSDHNHRNLTEFLTSALDSSAGYFAIMAYLNRDSDDAISQLRTMIEKKSARPTTFGWGPRFLHSTGQFHKGGPLVGSFIQITGQSMRDIAIPGTGYGFERLVLAQALGDNQALTARGLPVLRIHLKKRAAGIEEILRAMK